jgi:hypothetical protein
MAWCSQIRKLSVKRITSPLVYDNLKNAVPNGLYDAAMGPMETHDRRAARAHDCMLPSGFVKATAASCSHWLLRHKHTNDTW